MKSTCDKLFVEHGLDLSGQASQSFEYSVRVIYADVDQMGVVYHARYLYYFEIARGEMLRAIGFPYKQLEADGIFMPIIEAHLDYFKPAKYDDLLYVQCQVTRELGSKIRFKISCQIHNQDDLLVTGYTVHIASGSPIKLMRPPREPFNRVVKAMFSTSIT